MKTRPASLLLVAALVASTAFATTYVRVEKDGTKTYSDRPIPGGQPVELQSAQTYSAQPAPPPSPGNLPAEQALLAQMDNFRYDSCEITPKNDETFNNPEQVGIGVALKPNLRASDAVDLRIDGVAVGDRTTTSYTMQPVDRGTHTVTVMVKDRFGKPLCNAQASFHVQRPSLLSPARPTRPRPAPRN